MGKEKKEKKDKKDKKEKKEKKEKRDRREREESADESDYERGPSPEPPSRSKDKGGKAGKKKPVDVEDIEYEDAPASDKKRKDKRSKGDDKPKKKKGGDDSEDDRKDKRKKKMGKADSEDGDVETGGRPKSAGRRSSGGFRSGKSSAAGSAGVTGTDGEGEEEDWGEEEEEFDEYGEEGEEEWGEEEEEEESDAEDPEGAFIHPDDLELEEEYYDGEGEITYPGVIRPWEEAVAIAQEEAEDERLYDEDGFKYPFFVSPDQLEHLGFGVTLYLRETKMLSIVFFFMSCFAIPAIVFNYMVQKAYKVYGDSEEMFAQVSVGTQMIAIEENGVIVTDITYYGYTKDQILLACSFLDVAYTAIFLAVVIGMRAAFAKQVARKKGTKLTIDRFSVEVSGLPREVIDEEYAIELKDHFERLVGDGTVAEVAVATSNCSILDTITEKAEAVKLRRRYASIINRSRGAKGHRQYDKACAQVNALDEDIEKCMTASELYPSVAYVTFESVAAQIKCLNLCGGVIKSVLSRDARFRGRIIVTKPAPRPTSVNWQNLNTRKVERTLRGWSTHLISIAWITLTFLILTYADAFSEERPPVVDYLSTAKSGHLNCTASFPMEYLNGTRSNAWDNNVTKLYRRIVTNLTFTNPDFSSPECADWVHNRIFMGVMPADPESDSAVWTPITTNQTDIQLISERFAELLFNKSIVDEPDTNYSAVATKEYDDRYNEFTSYSCAAFVCYARYCQQKGRTGWYANTDGVGEFCTNYWMVWIKSSAILIAATVVGFFVERSIAGIAGNLADYEKHWTQERTLASMGFKVFLSTIFNMLGTLVITFGHIQGFPKGEGLLSLPFLFGGKFVDFTGSWYAEVGSAFTRTLAFQAIIPFLTELLFMAIWFGYRRLRRSAMVNQEELNELYANYEFEAPKSFGELHATLFVVMVLCPGLPIILWFFFAYLVNLQLFDRFVMLRLAEKPEELDEALAIESLDTIPWASVLHFAFGLWMFGAASSRYVFGGVDPSTQSTPSSFIWDATQSDQFNVKKRIFKTAGLPQFCALLAVSTVLPLYFFSRAISDFLKGLTTRQSRNGFEGMDPAILSIPVLRRIRPAYVLNPEDASMAGSRAGSEMSEFDLTKDREEPPDPGAKIIKLKTAHMQWSGPVSYDMTMDERHAKTFARASKTGHLTTYEASRFTVYDHGGRVKQIRGWGSPTGSPRRGEGEEGMGEEWYEEGEEEEGGEPLDYIEEEDENFDEEMYEEEGEEEAEEEEQQEEEVQEKKSKKHHKEKKDKKEKKEKKSKKEKK